MITNFENLKYIKIIFLIFSKLQYKKFIEKIELNFLSIIDLVSSI